jgi:prevent-host-death family protein
MKSISAKELKSRTGEVLRRVEEGEKVLITKRGKPCAVLFPVTEEHLLPVGLRPYAEAWEDIERTLKATQPRYKTWEEAMRWTRRRA